MNIEEREGGRVLQAWVSVSEYVVKWFCRIEKTDFSGIFLLHFLIIISMTMEISSGWRIV